MIIQTNITQLTMKKAETIIVKTLSLIKLEIKNIPQKFHQNICFVEVQNENDMKTPITSSLVILPSL
jgi:hypothetical protein